MSNKKPVDPFCLEWLEAHGLGVTVNQAGVVSIRTIPNKDKKEKSVVIGKGDSIVGAVMDAHDRSILKQDSRVLLMAAALSHGGSKLFGAVDAVWPDDDEEDEEDDDLGGGEEDFDDGCDDQDGDEEEEDEEDDDSEDRAPVRFLRS